ncbi:MAG: polymerase beta domain protein region protein [Candidatus Gottesmanbacteria bacterium GW2011_GWC2_39_8]|uniref:Polymerase beta domain protein region protein n=1 Tax=Candidatus Gottesmanbacteria bacterium GW2011_GWC2_39_8 TaxID=1618450 RepID=A0A0G0SBW0_9BACT|nr:MAG: polymerase beta domain protein region protein [Candidatus Gottesmanbacteria bacterium GW2011_GWC2_39_8]
MENIREKIKEKVKNYFKGKKEVTAAYLYGSYAKGTEKKDSDIDLALLFSKNQEDHLSFRIKYQEELSGILENEVEIQDLNITSINFAKRVLDEGILIIDNNSSERVVFEVNLFNNYFDMLPFYVDYYENLKNRALKGEFNARY